MSADRTQLAEPLLADAPTAAQMLCISPRQLWTLTKGGEMPCVRIGRRVLYPVERLREWVHARTQRGVHASV